MAKLVAGGPISEKLQRASIELDERLAAGAPVIGDLDDEETIAHYVRMYQVNQQMSGQMLRECIARTGRRHLGALVTARLRDLGLLEG